MSDTVQWFTETEFIRDLRLFVFEHNRALYLEPIPDPSDLQAEKAAATVIAINESVFGVERFPTLSLKCAAAFYELVKQHFFVNGNKRIAAFFLLDLLLLNSMWMPQDPGLAGLAERVAKSRPRDREKMIKLVQKFIEDHWGDFSLFEF